MLSAVADLPFWCRTVGEQAMACRVTPAVSRSAVPSSTFRAPVEGAAAVLGTAMVAQRAEGYGAAAPP